MNTKLVESLLEVIKALSPEERHLLETKLLAESAEVQTGELMLLAEKGGALAFLEYEPDIYTLDDGEPVP